MKKRISCRAILFQNDQLGTMHRIREDREYYTFPGGGLEEGETLAECVRREIEEEFGLEIEVGRLVYEYHSPTSLQYFFLCSIVGGTFGTGAGPEILHPKPGKGQYLPTWLPVAQLDQYPLEPSLLMNQFRTDYQAHGEQLSLDLQILEDPTY